MKLRSTLMAALAVSAVAMFSGCANMPGQHTIRAVSTDAAPKAIGPYSQAIRSGPMLFISGNLPINPATNQLLKDASIEVQTKQVLENIRATLAAEGMTMANVVSTSVFMQDLNEFTKMNEVYASFFTGATPARATVQVARLPRDVKIEIGAIAIKP